MTEIPIPESVRIPPEPVRIFSGARLNQDGTFVSPAHQMLSDLWTDEMQKTAPPGILRRIPQTIDNETRISLRITPRTPNAIVSLVKTRSNLETAVSRWVKDGQPKFSDINEFREHYMPEEQSKRQK